MRRYDISRDDRLRSTFELERIGSNSYLSIAGWATQTLRVNDIQGQQPIALPIIDYRQRLDDPLFGGQLELQLHTLAIGRTAAIGRANVRTPVTKEHLVCRLLSDNNTSKDT